MCFEFNGRVWNSSAVCIRNDAGDFLLLSDGRYGGEQNAAQGDDPTLSASGTRTYWSCSVFHCAIVGPR